MRLGTTLVYPVQRGVAIRGTHGSYRAPTRCSALPGSYLQFAKIFFRYFPVEEKLSKTRHKMLQFVKFPGKRERSYYRYSELSANFLVQSESGAAAFLARFWPVLVRVRVRGMGWVYARTLIPPERGNT